MVDRGVLYIAIGEQHYLEARVSLASLRQYSDLPATLVTDRDETAAGFSCVERTEGAGLYRAKVMCMLPLPYERTLFLDTDTFVCSDVGLMFDVLDRFDVAGAMDAGRTNWPTETRVPGGFPELNSGVLLFRRNEVVEGVLREWLRLFDDLVAGNVKYQRPGDQGALREALYHSDARVAVLPPEFNFRFDYLACLMGMVRIMHGRNCDDLARLRDEVNRNGRMRLYRPKVGIL